MKKNGDRATTKDRIGKRIEIHRQNCGRCGICIEFCPQGVLAKNQDGFPEVVSLEKCTVCRLCELWCPDLCIFIVEEMS